MYKRQAQSPAASYVPLPRFLLQDEALRDISNDAKVLYGGLSAQELTDALTLPPEKVAPVFAELTGNGYLEILEENGAFGLHLKG